MLVQEHSPYQAPRRTSDANRHWSIASFGDNHAASRTITPSGAAVRARHSPSSADQDPDGIAQDGRSRSLRSQGVVVSGQPRSTLFYAP